MGILILNILAFITLLYIIHPKDNRTINKYGVHTEYDNNGNISIVRSNMMNDKTYRGYCGNSWNEQKRLHCDMPRTRWNPYLKQFYCPKCGWTSKYPTDFIKRYINQHQLNPQ